MTLTAVKISSAAQTVAGSSAPAGSPLSRFAAPSGGESSASRKRIVLWGSTFPSAKMTGALLPCSATPPPATAGVCTPRPESRCLPAQPLQAPTCSARVSPSYTCVARLYIYQQWLACMKTFHEFTGDGIAIKGGK